VEGVELVPFLWQAYPFEEYGEDGPENGTAKDT
jgi:hypothetical protein